MDFDLIYEIEPIALQLIFLYTELHYRFPFFPSRYFIKQPEIVSDIPHRINPDEEIPIFLFVKDADQYPILIKDVTIIFFISEKLIHKEIININKNIKKHFWSKVFLIGSIDYKGDILADISINYQINNKNLNCINHNIKSLKKLPLKIKLAEEPFPGCKNVQWGDLHYHSNLTEDMVEFGAPLKDTLTACQALGLDFICNTDHSYDLDDMEGSWTESDPDLKKWNRSREKIKKLNNQFNFSPFMIPSEELTMHNSINRNIHALILNNDAFLPGRGDGAENGLNFDTEHNSNSLYKELEKKAICIAAHPFVSVPIMQWLFFKRGVWEDFDILQERMSGLQILNGEIDRDFARGVKEWIHYLLNGHKKFIYAGNDAHGNFNIFRQIKIPMLKIQEADKQILGRCRTGVFPANHQNIESTIKALKAGNCFITNGPYININLNEDIKMGDQLEADSAELFISVKSTPEFGKILGIRIFHGIIGDKKESLTYEEINKGSKYTLEYSGKIIINQKGYLRVETETECSSKKYLAMSNPIWYIPLNN